MFDLEQSIKEWRRQMLAAGVKSPVPLEELESHLRDEVEQQQVAGRRETAAFARAVRKVGQPKLLKNEFQKNERSPMKKTLLIALGVFGVLTGPAFILPALAWRQHHGSLPFEQFSFLALGVLIVVGCLAGSIYGLKKRTA